MDSERDYVVSLALVPGIGPRRLATLLGAFGSAREAWAASKEALIASGLPRPTATALAGLRRSSGGGLPVAGLGRRGVRALTHLDEDYPRALLCVADHPPVLFVRGNPRCLSRPAVAVVGTRRPTPYGRETATRIAGGLAAAGCVVVSGLAVGIDTAAHRGALAAGGETVAVLGSGHDHIYPSRRSALAAEIARRGAVISQFGPDTLPREGTFPARNFVIAGLSRGVVVVEAPLQSGALGTAAWALAFGRPLMAVPGPVTTASFHGCHRLLREGGRLVSGPEDVLEEIGLDDRQAGWDDMKGRRRPPGSRRPSASGDVRPPRGGNLDRTRAGSGIPSGPAGAVLRAMVPGEVVPFALLMARTGLGADRLGALLGLLELDGLVEKRPGESYTRTTG